MIPPYHSSDRYPKHLAIRIANLCQLAINIPRSIVSIPRSKVWDVAIIEAVCMKSLTIKRSARANNPHIYLFVANNPTDVQLPSFLPSYLPTFLPNCMP